MLRPPSSQAMSYRRIRFATQKNLPPVPDQSPFSGPAQQQVATPPLTSRETRPKSKLGCRECRLRRVKCDETFPVCNRCLARGSICLPAARSSQWIYEMPPGLSIQLPTLPHIQPRQLQYWLEKASQILIIDVENNPWSFPILKYLNQSPALVHAIQSVSSGHETFFNGANRRNMLEQRGLALTALRQELNTVGNTAHLSVFFTAYLLMVSSSNLDIDMQHYGQEHVAGARAVLYSMLETGQTADIDTLHLLLGYYVYLDMVTSYLSEPAEQVENNDELLYAAIQQTRHMNHPLVGYCKEIMYLLGTLGRHCRRVLETSQRDRVLEATIEGQMLDWDCTMDISELDALSYAFRNTGLILLYRICGAGPRTFEHEEQVYESNDMALNSIIRRLSLEIIHHLDKISSSSCFVNIFPLPLLTAGSELTAEDDEQRLHVVERFTAVYSFNRVPASLAAIQLLKNVWAQRDQGSMLSWIQVMLLMKWKLTVS